MLTRDGSVYAIDQNISAIPKLSGYEENYKNHFAKLSSFLQVYRREDLILDPFEFNFETEIGIHNLLLIVYLLLIQQRQLTLLRTEFELLFSPQQI